MKKINIIMGEDKSGHGLEPIFVTISSLADANSMNVIDIYLHTNFDSEDFAPIFDYIKIYPNISLKLHPLLDFLGPETNNNVLQKVIYQRLIYPFAYAWLDKYLYLDADLLVSSDLSALWEEDISDYLIGGVLEHHVMREMKASQLGISTNYINSGVLLYNAKLWRSQVDPWKAIKWLDFNLPFYGSGLTDQDAINWLCDGYVHTIPSEWNRMLKNGEFAKTTKNNILHFAGPIKPWMPYADFDFQLIYRDQLCRVVSNPTLRNSVTNFAQYISIAHQLYRRGNLRVAIENYKKALSTQDCPSWYFEFFPLDAPSKELSEIELRNLINLLEERGFVLSFLSPYELPGILN